MKQPGSPRTIFTTITLKKKSMSSSLSKQFGNSVPGASIWDWDLGQNCPLSKALAGTEIHLTAKLRAPATA